MSRRWRVQAFLLPDITGGDEFAYRPSFFRFRWQAVKFRRSLEASFAPGMVRTEMSR